MKKPTLFAMSAFVVAAALYKAGAPLPALAAGIALAGFVTLLRSLRAAAR